MRSVPGDRIERFFPQCRLHSKGTATQPHGVKPLFPGYVFARFCPALDLDRVRYARGVLRVVNAGGVPLPIEDETIYELRDSLDADGCLVLRPRVFDPGERVSIETGLLRGLLGLVEREWDDGRRVAILLDALLRSRVIVDRACLAPVAASA